MNYVEASKILEISLNEINIELIKTNYKRLTRKYHPDVRSDNTNEVNYREQQQKINEAKSILLDYAKNPIKHNHADTFSTFFYKPSAFTRFGKSKADVLKASEKINCLEVDYSLLKLHIDKAKESNKIKMYPSYSDGYRIHVKTSTGNVYHLQCEKEPFFNIDSPILDDHNLFAYDRMFKELSTYENDTGYEMLTGFSINMIAGEYNQYRDKFFERYPKESSDMCDDTQFCYIANVVSFFIPNYFLKDEDGYFFVDHFGNINTDHNCHELSGNDAGFDEIFV